ncbi:MAG: HEPN domain-containing protein [Coriobacteriia bacterium]
MKQRTREWMTKARVDLLSAKVLFDAGLTDPACFHSQQSAEKYLKALPEEHDRVFPEPMICSFSLTWSHRT